MAENAASIHTVTNAAGKVWAPILCRFVPNEILQIIQQYTLNASCRRIEDAEHLSAAGFRSVLITIPIVHPEGLTRVSALASQAELTVVIDHFRHAELLSQALLAAVLSASLSADVLIDVDLGRRVTGVRPGPDSALLAAAIARLPNIRLRGVYVDVRECTTTGPNGSALSFEESIGVAAHCRRIIEAGGIPCAEIVSGQSHVAALSAMSAVTVVMASPLSAGTKSTGQGAAHLNDNSKAALELVCSVVSRPSLEWCVIDAGRLSWGDARYLQVLHPSGARLLHALPEVATLQLSGESMDLRIGDTVILSHPDFAERLHLMSSREIH